MNKTREPTGCFDLYECKKIWGWELVKSHREHDAMLGRGEAVRGVTGDGGEMSAKTNVLTALPTTDELSR